MKLEEYEKLEQLKKDLDLGESWKIGHCWDISSRNKIKCVFKSSVNSEYEFRCFQIVKGCVVMISFRYTEEVPKPKAPKYRPFKNYAEFVKHWPSEKRYRMYVKNAMYTLSLEQIYSDTNFAEALDIENKILTEEQVINEDYENGIPFGVLEEGE